MIYVHLQAFVSGNAFLGYEVGVDYAFEYGFYLSKDRVVDEDDLRLPYSMEDYKENLTQPIYSFEIFNLNSKDELLVSKYKCL